MFLGHHVDRACFLGADAVSSAPFDAWVTSIFARAVPLVLIGWTDSFSGSFYDGAGLAHLFSCAVAFISVGWSDVLSSSSSFVGCGFPHVFAVASDSVG